MSNIISCPDCGRSLNVPDGMEGKKVKCPSCGSIFVAPAPGDSVSARSSEPLTEDPIPRRRPPAPPPPPQSTPPPPPSRGFDDDDEEDRPRRRRRRPLDDDDDYPRRPRYGSGYSGDGGGGAPLVLGILSLVFCWAPLIGVILGILAVTIPPPPGGSSAGKVCGAIGLILSCTCFLGACLIGLSGGLHH